ncbi:MAG TPA: hypothetical protein VMT52_13030, partial [Planctomycetota bacterium]|nr:hypothetical protein [Planctomycetota bacterium]
MTITRRFCALAAVACLAAAASVPLRAATIVPPASLADLASRSDAVVLAEARGSWSLARGSLIFTRTEFILVESVSGDGLPGASIEVEAPGGEAEGKAWVVPGSPRFVEGQRYLLPLSRRTGGPWILAMLSWGILEEAEGLGGRLLLAPMAGTDLPEALPRLDGLTPEPIGVYGEEALLDHLGQVLDGRSAWDSSLASARPEELPASGRGAAVPGQCAFLGSGAANARWRAFDSSGTATIFADSTG